MRRHQEMQILTAMENPLIALQVKLHAGDSGWATERIFIDGDDAREFLAPQRPRYPEDEEQETWRLYPIPAEGRLAHVVKVARWAAEKETPGKEDRGAAS